MSEERQRLLARVIDELDEHGIRDRSLRELAARLGTSHRMLIHHFGSREGMLVEVVERVERGERERAAALRIRPGAGVAEAIRAQWRHFSRPEFAGRERLFFECYARGLTGEPPFDRMIPAAIDSWVSEVGNGLQAAGLPPARARATARLYVAVMRGLLLDLLATGDRRAGTAALEVFLAGHDPLAGVTRPGSASLGAPSPDRATTSPPRGRRG
jgi:AcrR family transcriptional regulator